MVARLSVSLAFFLSVLAPGAASAQVTGTVAGRVTDMSGAVVPGATIDAIDTNTGQVRTTTTAADGFYTIPLLNPKVYRLRAAMRGFRTSLRDGCEVVGNETARMDFSLEVGDLSQQVTVGALPLVETRNATLGIVVDQRSVLDLPLNGRNFAQLGTLMPGVVAPPAALGGLNGNATAGGGIGNPTGSFNVNGMRNQSNNFMLDGAPNNDSFNTGFVVRPPPDAIQEFKILTHSFGAEYGRNAGSVVSVVTKAGTNQWRGTLWEFNRDEALQAKNVFATSKPTLKQNQFGGASGGPLISGRLFLFGYYEGFQNTEGQTDTRAVLSLSQRHGDFSGGTVIRDPLTGAPFPGNIIPASRIHSISRALVDAYIPVPNRDDNRVGRSPEIEDTRRQFGVRMDYKPNAAHSLLARYINGRTTRTNPLGASNFAPADDTSGATVHDFMASDTWLLRTNRFNVMRLSWNRIDTEPTRSSGLSPRELGFAYSGSSGASVGLPFVLVQGYFTTGDSQQQFTRRANSVFTVADDFMWVSGPHAVKFGGELQRDHTTASYSFDPNGDYTFSGQYSGNAAADFLLGFPSVFRQATGDPNLDGSAWEYGAYVQDEYRVTTRVTLSYGLRYEVARPFQETRDRVSAFHPGQQSTVFPDAPVGLVYPGDDGVPRGTYSTDINNLAPRVAVVWDPEGDGRTSVRSAWGLYYDSLPGQGDYFQSVVASPFQSITAVTFPLQATASPFANPLAGLTSTSAFPPGLTFVGWGPAFATPVTQHFNVSLQRQLGDQWSVEIGYVGSRADKLPIFMEANPTTPILSPAPTVGPRVYPAFSLLRPTFPVAKSWYDSLQASARMRSWRGLNMVASYTLGHAVDHVSALNVGGEPRPMLPVTIGDDVTIGAALAREKSDALFDVRHRFVLGFTYELPLLDSFPLMLRGLLRSWQLSGIVQGQTGFPFTVIEPNNVSLTSLTNRPNQTCDPNRGGARTITQWFNTSCFQRLSIAANAGQIGNERRNSVRGPGFNRLDLTLSRALFLKRGTQIALRLEVFNALNTVRLNQPGNQLGSPTFGQITSADDGRIVQLGIKYVF